MADANYKYIVIGKGMIGSAAARHLAERTDGVALIGPDEPRDPANHDGAFADHYDEGRITRILDPHLVWAKLARESIRRYRDMESRSGIAFYHEVGQLSVGPLDRAVSEYVPNSEQVMLDLNEGFEKLGPEILESRFPKLSFESQCSGLYQSSDAGHISARGIVVAETALARGHGADVISEEAVSAESGTGGVEVRTSGGGVYRADRILVAAGGFTRDSGLVPRTLDVDVLAVNVVYIELTESEAGDLSNLPSMIYMTGRPNDSCYIVPPVQYRDGKYRMKIGGSEGHAGLGSMAGDQGVVQGAGHVGGARPPMGQDPGHDSLPASYPRRTRDSRHLRREQDPYGAALHRYGGRAHRRGNGRQRTCGEVGGRDREAGRADPTRGDVGLGHRSEPLQGEDSDARVKRRVNGQQLRHEPG